MIMKFIRALWTGYWPPAGDEAGERLATAAERESYGVSA